MSDTLLLSGYSSSCNSNALSTQPKRQIAAQTASIKRVISAQISIPMFSSFNFSKFYSNFYCYSYLHFFSFNFCESFVRPLNYITSQNNDFTSQKVTVYAVLPSHSLLFMIPIHSRLKELLNYQFDSCIINIDD